ncbi:hypothetical protein nbrc107696_13370 [Gordonia spumicola]|uniref:Uncharacterized protein n=1 Tax=Gordonia spumicola TaxID=589161 RepID=A0A7I9V745_9ACTN|nr:hypothetical protein nbrc107696_13370 [Gordonia spumicola]
MTLTPVSDEAINVAVDDAYRSKYAGQQSSMNIMIGDVARPSTVRVDPSV